MREFVKLVFDKMLNLFKKNPAIQEFDIFLAKIIFVLSN